MWKPSSLGLVVGWDQVSQWGKKAKKKSANEASGEVQSGGIGKHVGYLVVVSVWIFVCLFVFVFALYIGAPRFPESPPGQVTGFLGKETRLQCNLLGNPTPEVKWTRSPPAPLPQGRSEVRKDGLYINNTKSEDGGVYTCFATNEYGMVIHGAFLKVKAVGKWD